MTIRTTWDPGMNVLPETWTSDVRIPVGGPDLEATLSIPSGASSIVVFSHGSGSSRHSPRNRFVASKLHEAGIATLLMNLLTLRESVSQASRLDPRILTPRLSAATRWLAERPETSGLSVGYFGSSSGAAIAMRAAAEPGNRIHAVVSRGGRPDTAETALPRVKAPTLLIVGGDDVTVLELNRWAYERLASPIKEIAVVPGALHLFREPGALEQVAGLASRWFRTHLSVLPKRNAG